MYGSEKQIDLKLREVDDRPFPSLEGGFLETLLETQFCGPCLLHCSWTRTSEAFRKAALDRDLCWLMTGCFIIEQKLQAEISDTFPPLCDKPRSIQLKVLEPMQLHHEQAEELCVLLATNMDLLNGAYDESDHESSTEQEPSIESTLVPVQLLKRTVNSAPFVNPALKTLQNRPGLLAPTQRELTLNLKASTLQAPLQGPAHPYRRDMDMVGGDKLITGGLKEDAVIEKWNFHNQYHTFHNQGYIRDDSGAVVGDAIRFIQKEAASSQPTEGCVTQTQIRRDKKRKAKEEESMNLGDEDEGPWAPVPEDRVITELELGTLTDDQKRFRKDVADRKARKYREYNEEEDIDRRDERKMAHLLPPRHDRDTKALEPTSQFHGKAEKDYQGRSWVEPPAGVRASDGDHTCYIPKKCIHRYTGHTKGVQAIEFFPKLGHLLLSGSLDGKCKIWDVYNERQVKRTYSGHSAAVRCINFNEDGSRFITGGFDRFMRIWDTETGQCLQTVTNRKVPYCMRHYPRNNNQFIVGMSDNRLYTFDCTSGEMVQEYNHHLAAINSVTFYEDGLRFASTSDDKKLLLWEWDIPVPIKYIAEPGMHSMPAVTSHPSGAFLACQSLDNTIRVYQCKDRFKEMRKKIFRGHTIAGYACQVGFSPNGKFICSGDGEGKLHFWDFKTTKVYCKYRAHDNGPCIGTIWHPNEPSWVATCGWDGVIKLWD